jgi:hypothetical protein
MIEYHFHENQIIDIQTYIKTLGNREFLYILRNELFYKKEIWIHVILSENQESKLVNKQFENISTFISYLCEKSFFWYFKNLIFHLWKNVYQDFH